MRLQLTRSGRLRCRRKSSEHRASTTENARYEERVKDLAVATPGRAHRSSSFRRNFTKPKAVADGPISS